MSQFLVFISFRVKEAEKQALALRAALQKRGVLAFCSSCDLKRTGDWINDITAALAACNLMVILATRTYGAQGTDAFGTYEELRTARKWRKPLYVVPMSETMEVITTEVLLSSVQKGVSWTTAPDEVPEPLLDDLVGVCSDISSASDPGVAEHQQAQKGSFAQTKANPEEKVPDLNSAAEHQDIQGESPTQVESNTKEKVTELKLTSGSLLGLQRSLAAGAGLVLDLCGRSLDGILMGTLEPLEFCTVKNGKILLSTNDYVKITAAGVRFQDLTIMGVGTQEACVVVVGRGSLHMEGCCVEGGEASAVGVLGSSASLNAQQTTMRSSEGNGLTVSEGGKAVLEQCTSSENGCHGVAVGNDGSSLQAVRCQVEENGSSNIYVTDGAHACLEEVTSNSSKDGCGVRADGQGSSISVTGSKANGNAVGGICAGSGASITLANCECDDNEEYGLKAVDSGSSILAEDSLARSNGKGNIFEEDGGVITLRGSCDVLTVLQGKDKKSAVGGLLDLQKTLAFGHGRVLDLYGRTLDGPLTGDLEPPTRCILKNGTLVLSSTANVKVTAAGVRFQELTIKGVGTQEACVAVLGRGSLQMEGCCVEGGETSAVSVAGSSASLTAQQMSMHSSKGDGLTVSEGGKAVLEECTSSESGCSGVAVDGSGSSLHAARCRVDANESSNISVTDGAHACLEEVICNSSKDGCGVRADGQSSSISVTGSKANGNAAAGVCAESGASIELANCECDDNKEYGFKAVDSGSRILAEDGHARWNGDGDTCEQDGGVITLRSCDVLTVIQGAEKKSTLGGLLDLQKVLAFGHSRVLDLCGRTLDGPLTGDLEPPASSTLKNGTLVLPGPAYVRVAAAGVRFQDLTIKGLGDQIVWVEAGSLQIEGCRVEGGSTSAVRVSGSSSLSAHNSALQSSRGTGLWVRGGSRAALEECTTSDNGCIGVDVGDEGSSVRAAQCQANGNAQGGAVARDGASLELEHCHCNDNKLHGICASGAGSSMMATQCQASENAQCGAAAFSGASLELEHCQCNGNKLSGMQALESGSSMKATRCQASWNAGTGAEAFSGASLELEHCQCNNNKLSGMSASGSGSSIMAEDSSACRNNSGARVGEGGSLTLLRCQCHSNKSKGWEASGSGSSLQATESVASGNEEAGAVAGGSASIVLEQCKCKYNEGNGWVAKGSGSSLKSTKSEAFGNASAGALTEDSASIVLEQCKCNDNKKAGLRANGSGSSILAEESYVKWNGTSLFGMSNTSEEDGGLITFRGSVDVLTSVTQVTNLEPTSGGLLDLWKTLERGHGRVLDLCGRTLNGRLGFDLELSAPITLKNGTLVLPGSAHVKVTAAGVRFQDLTIKGVGTQISCVAVRGSGSLQMAGCHVEGGGVEERILDLVLKLGGAVTVKDGSLSAQQTTFYSTRGHGLVGLQGSTLTVDRCTACGGSYARGIYVDKGCTLYRSPCVSGNGNNNRRNQPATDSSCCALQ